MEVVNSRRNNQLPLRNWPDQRARHQIINAVIYHEKYTAYKERRRNWAVSAQKHLTKWGINISTARLNQIDRALRNGERAYMSASAFRGSDIKPRGDKDVMYAGMYMVENCILDGKHYIGLAADQILSVASRYDTVTICERDPEMVAFMLFLKRTYMPQKPIALHHCDIFEFLNKTDKKFSVYDFDLMCYATPELASSIANAVTKTSEDMSVVNTVTCIGRKITRKKYRQIMPEKLIGAIEGVNGWEANKIEPPDKYGKSRDSAMPMRYELLFVQKSR